MKIKPFKLERYFAEHEFSTPYLLCSSDCESISLGELLNMEKGSSEQLNKLWLGYTESNGDPELRYLISQLYESQSKDEILVFAGAEEAIYIYMNIALDKNDSIIVQTPCYQSLLEVAGSIGCELIKWEMDADKGWYLDINKLETLIKPTTKLIVINSPHNPTGYCIPESDYREIVRIANKHNILIFSDEVYKFSEYDTIDRLPSVCDIYKNGVSLGVMSKSFGLAGLRIGWIATKNTKLLEDLQSYKDYTSICNSAPSEYLAKVALRNKEDILERNINLLKNNLEILYKFFTNNSELFEYYIPKAGSIMFPGFKMDIKAKEFCSKLKEKKGVLLLPGDLYDHYPGNFRLGYGRYNMPEALQKVQEFINENYLNPTI